MTARKDGMIDKAMRQSVAYGTATILSRATLLVALIVLPFILTPADYGALSMIVTIAALIAVIVPLEVSQGLARHYASAKAAEKEAYASSAWSFLLLAVLAFLLLGQVLAEPLTRLILGDPVYLTMFRIALVYMALNCLFLFLQNQCRWEFRTAEYVLISLLFSFATLGLGLGLGVVLEPPLSGVVLGQAIGAAAAVGLGALVLRRGFSVRIVPARLREMLRFSLPLVPAGLALFVSVHASRLILNAEATLIDVGVYALASQIASIATLGAVGVQSALVPLVMAHYQEPQTPGHIARIFEGFAGVSLVACLALGLFAPDFLRLFDSLAYEAAGPLVLVIAPGLVMAQMYVFAPGFAIAKRTDIQMWVSFAGAAVAVVANYWLIGLWGIMGAAIATLVAAAVFLSLWFLFSQKFYRVPVRWGPVAAVTAAAALFGYAGLSVELPNLAAGLGAKAAMVAALAGLVFLTRLMPLRASVAVARSYAAPFWPSFKRG